MNVLHITAYLDIREKMGPNSLQQTRKAPGRFPARGVEVVLVKKKVGHYVFVDIFCPCQTRSSVNDFLTAQVTQQRGKS